MLPPDPKKMLPNKASDMASDRIVSAQAQELPPVESTAPPAAVTAPPGLGTMLHAFRRCWWWALPVALIVGLVAVGVALVVYPGAYVSSAVFRIRTQAGHAAQEEEGQFANVQRSYTSLLKSHAVLAEAIEKSQVAEKYGVSYTPQSLSKKMVVAFNEGPEVMNVSLSGDNPEALAAILNALGEVFPAKVAQIEDERLKSRIAQLRRRLDVSGDRRDPGRALTLAEQLFDKRQELSKAEKDYGLDDAATLKSKYQHALGMLGSAQRDLQTRKQELNGALAKAGQPADGTATRVPVAVVSDADVEDALSRTPEYAAVLQDVKKLRASLAVARREYRGEALRKILSSIRADLRDLEDERKEFEEEARQKLQRKAEKESALQAVQNKARVEELKRQVASLEQDAATWTRKAEEAQSGGPKVPPEVAALRDQVTQLENEAKEIGAEVAKLTGSLGGEPRVRLHAEAFVPQERDTSRSYKVAVAVGMLAFLGLVAGMCLLEATGRRVYSSGDVLQGLGMRIVGTLPRLPSALRKKSAQAQVLGGLDARYGMTEAVDAIRTVLMSSPRNDGARVILVTSAIGGEGKTTLASHLAASLSRAWRKTLLIDGDLRKPALHSQLDLPLEPGFSEALRGEIEFDDAVKPTLTSRLWLMPAGKVDGHSLQALAQEGLASVFDLLKDQYDFIVIDTSPVLLVPDGLLLAQQADAVLLSVMRDHSRLPAVYAAQQKLASLGIAVLGGVMIGEKTEVYGHAVPYPRT
jgi:succinoglycan biosynthesis transport protein ExoP